MSQVKTVAPKFTPAQCEAIHAEANAAGRAAADAMDVWHGCGFAWVNVKPATSSFAKWQKAQGIARYSEYEKAMQLWVSNYGQHANKKYAYANAYAEVLVRHGIKATAGDRAD